MRPMKHGYTNETVGDARTVDKAYRGPDAALRLARELEMLTALRGHLPVPPVIATPSGALTLGFMAGAHGQDLIDQGHAARVLHSCGGLLRRLHGLDPGSLGLGGCRAGQVLVQGDFGPNNVLIDPEGFAVTALLDWEFAHLGDPIEDLAWCEWIVRTHHPDHTGEIADFFDAYNGHVLDWPQRQAVMVARCLELQTFCERWEPGGHSAQQWTQRAHTTANWQEQEVRRPSPPARRLRAAQSTDSPGFLEADTLRASTPLGCAPVVLRATPANRFWWAAPAPVARRPVRRRDSRT
jgi:hypothetical protein